MKIANTKFKKIILFVTSAVILAVIVVILLISPIAKYLLEKYVEKYTHRQIHMSWIYVNPFTGYVHISNLKIYESKNLSGYREGDSVFFTAKNVYANFAMLKLLSKTIEISEITLDQPKGIIIQNRKVLNFTDLIKTFTPVKPRTTPARFHFNILAIKIMDGEFHYHEIQTPVNYFIKKFNLESTGKRWNADTIAGQFSFIPGIGSGDVKAGFTINFNTRGYRYALVAHNFDLNIIQQYLTEMTNKGSFSATLDADMKARGSFTNEEDVTMSGQLAINDFHFGKNPKDDLASIDKLVLAIIEVSPINHKYIFDSVSVNHPYFKYERYDKLDNLQRMFGEKGANIANASTDPDKFNLVVEIARYVKVLAKNFFRSQYKINRLGIYGGDFKYNDFAIIEKFSMDASPLYVLADSIDKNRDWVDISFKSGLKPYGNVAVKVNISPRDSTDFDIQYHLQKLPVSVFNPYLITYTSYPVDRGTIEIDGAWKVRKGIIQSVNHLVILDPRVVRRLKNKGSKWLPMRLIMSLVRERGNVIDYEIPITGNLKNPKFHLHDVLMNLITNIFVKPATASYRMEVKNIESEIESSQTLKWKMRNSVLVPDQEKFIETMAGFLVKNSGASIIVSPQQYAIKEKEYILFFEAKKKYLLLTEHLNTRSFSEDDSEKVEKMSVKDSSFVHFLDKRFSDTLFTIQEKCGRFVDPAIINARFLRLNRERETAFIFYFKKREVEKQLKFSPAVNIIPYNGFSFYKIDYKGEIPRALVKAHRKMNELNDEAPRKKFEKERKKNRSKL